MALESKDYINSRLDTTEGKIHELKDGGKEIALSAAKIFKNIKDFKRHEGE